MRRLLPTLALALVAAAAAAACNGGGGGADAPRPGTLAAGGTVATATTEGPRPGEATGAFVFRTRCAACHGARGEGELGPALTGVAQRMAVADEEAVVRGGRARMPAFGAGLSDEQLRAVVEFTRTQLG